MDEVVQKRSAALQPPPDRSGSAAARDILEGLLETIPGAALVTGLAGFYFPPKSEREREAWEKAVSENSNEQSRMLARLRSLLEAQETRLSPLALLVAGEMLRACPDGLAETFQEVDDIRSRVQAENADGLMDAVHELISEGLVEKRSVIGSSRIRPSQSLYERLDEAVMGWDPRRDALALAELQLQHLKAQSPDLLALTGWSIRRFNPAHSHVFLAHPEWVWRDRFGSNFRSYGLVVGDAERAGLMRFIARAGTP